MIAFHVTCNQNMEMNDNEDLLIMINMYLSIWPTTQHLKSNMQLVLVILTEEI